MVLRCAPLRPPRAHGGDVGLELLDLDAVGLGRQLHERVQRHLHPGTAGLVDLHEVGKDAAHDGLVGDDQDVLRPLQLHHDGLQADDDVAVRLAAPVAVVVLVVVARPEVFGVLLVDLLICHAVAVARVELVERLPLQLLPPELAHGGRGRLVGAPERAGPDGQGRVLGQARLAEELGQHLRVLEAARAEVGVAADLAFEVVLALPVAGEPDGPGLDVEVGQEVHQPGLQVVLDAVDDDLVAEVRHFDVGELFLGLVDGLVHLLVHFDAVPEILGRLFGVLSAPMSAETAKLIGFVPDVIWRSGLHFENVCHDEVFIVAFALHEQVRHLGRFEFLVNPLATRLGRVGGIQDSHLVHRVPQPVQHVGDGCLGRRATGLLSLRVARFEKLGIWMRRPLASVLADVEYLCLDGRPP